MAALAVPVAVVPAMSVPVLAQDTSEARLRRIEGELRALQRKVFPGGDGKLFAPEITAAQAAAGTPAAPATTPVTDLLRRMDSIEAQIARLTAQTEQNANRLGLIEAKLGMAAAPAAGTAPAPAASGPAVPASTAVPAATTPAAAPAATAAAAPAAVAAAPATPAPAPAIAPAPAAKPAPTAPAGPSAQRLAAVRAIVKPQTDDPGEDDYSYGFRLWEARFFPEAQQQLKLYVDKYPRHPRVSFGRNLLGRAFLDDGKPREAATWFLQNYQADKAGARAPDSLLYLAVAMKELKDNSRTCIALGEFAQTYAAEAAGRLKSAYDAARAGVKCNS